MGCQFFLRLFLLDKFPKEGMHFNKEHTETLTVIKLFMVS